MRSPVVRRTALAASAAALALLATACGGSSDGDSKVEAGDGKTTQAEKTPSAAPAKALTADELEKVALAQKDVDNGKVDTRITGADDVKKEQVKAEDAACQPLALTQASAAQGDPAATVKRVWTEAGKKKPSASDAMSEEAMLASLDLDKVILTLASYEDGGAETVLKDTKASLEKCAGGFTYTGAGEKVKTLKVAETEAPEGADEALAMTMTIAADGGDKMIFKAVVARKDTTVASFVALNLAAAATGKDFEFPTRIVDTQLAKLK
ncbi:hypothetical protein [Streptomyces kebangsaanensis]|uniref:hypothetical protein n=1 Tax=Streptomyces kebangsaanensis TaxID=864058 RepID=UPI00093FAEFE|nr:hypothetical protein [Streptomyces kebangsaanensis]